jgi:hypothetical protein
MWAYGRITPPLPFKELNRRRFIATGFGHALDYVRFRKLGMFLLIHGIIFHEEVGHRLGAPLHKNRNLRYLHTPGKIPSGRESTLAPSAPRNGGAT